MTNKKRKHNNQITLIREIIMCVICLISITLALFFVFKFHALKIENEKVVSELAVYNDPENPYYSAAEVEEKIAEAREQATDEAQKKVIDDLLADIKDDLIENSSSISTIRSLFPDEMVIIDDNQYYFFPISKDLKQSSVDSEKLILDDNGLMHYSDSEYETEVGIDVSKFQEKINWEKVSKNDIDFAIIRVGNRGYSEGELFLDTTFEDNMKGARKNGIGVGVYFFTQAVSDEEAKEEAEFVLDSIEPYSVTYPVVIDVESIGGNEGRGNALSAKERTQYTKTFCQIIENAGYTPMIYGNLKTFLLMLDMNELEDYPKWFAGYSDTPYFPYEYDIWQYTDVGKISGINSTVDLNIYFKKN